MEQIRLLHYGVGAMGAGIARLVATKPGLASVAAYDRSESKQGRDLGELAGLARPLGLAIADSLTDAMAGAGNVMVALHATSSFTRDVAPELLELLELGLNVITIAEEMAYPWYGQQALAAQLDNVARANGVTLLGTGVNPGFVLDTLIICLTSACARVDGIRAKRVNDLAPFGPTVLRTQGVGTTPEAFAAGLASGEIVGHVGFPESMCLIAKALGWQLNEITQEVHPIVASVARRAAHATVEPGMVAGSRHTARGWWDGQVIIELDHPQQVQPEAEGVATGDYIWLQGDPPVSLAIQPEIPGGTGTIAMTVNMIPWVAAAPPGLLDMTDLPLPRLLTGWRGTPATIRGEG